MKQPRFITQGVLQKLPLLLQCVLWDMTETIPEPDYLQVFTLSEQNGKQKIEHTQEIPPYRRVLFLESKNPISAKVFVIDDTTHTTMLLNHEY